MLVGCGLPLLVLLLAGAWPAAAGWLAIAGLGVFALGHGLGAGRFRRQRPAPPGATAVPPLLPGGTLAQLRPYRLPVVGGVLASGLLLAVYFIVVTLVSGWSQTLSQFAQFRFYIVSLALGFGLQVGLYLYLRQQHRRASAGSAVAVSGTTSTAAMVSCCTHYLANVLPAIATAGIASFVSQYQIQLFWVGLLFNFAGVAYLGSLAIKMRRQAALVQPPVA